MKKIIAILLSVVVTAALFAGCATTPAAPAADDGRLQIVCTVFPIYDWVMNILGDKASDADVTMLLDNGVDLHSYQATAEDLMTIKNADVFCYVGGNSDKWVNDLSVDLTDVACLDLMDILSDAVMEEETALESEEKEEEEEGIEYDEHVWMSLRNAKTCIEKLTAVICEKDTDNAAAYKANSEAYLAKLSALDGQYKTVVDSAEKKLLVFADRFPFSYLCKDYGIEHIAAFAGCSTESNASFDTVFRLADSLNENNLSYVMITETGDGKIADTVIEKAGRSDIEKLTLNAMQSVTKADMNSTSYYNVMEENLEVLREALS